MWKSWLGFWVMIAAVLVGAPAAVWFVTLPPRVAQSHNALLNQAYVWQRAWDPTVRDAVTSAGKDFEKLVFLAAEISWKNGEAHVVAIRADHAALRASGAKIGLAVRVGPLPKPHEGAFARSSDETKLLLQTVREALETARRAGVSVAEVQIDFDSSEADLAGYRQWIGAVKEVSKPSPVLITALPSWLDRAAFAEVAREAGEFVLQVHSVQAPKSANAKMSLCDPDQARMWVDEAARVGVPFRVALPTYGYVAAFSEDGKLLGLTAEGASPQWPAGTKLCRIMADPAEMAALVSSWKSSHPEALKSIIWYRLPVEKDVMNWRAVTLSKVMQGVAPQPKLVAELEKGQEKNIVEVYLANRGEADSDVALDVIVDEPAAREIVAADALEGCEKLDAPASSVAFRWTPRNVIERLRPGERRQVGWIRLASDKEVRAHVATTNPADN